MRPRNKHERKIIKERKYKQRVVNYFGLKTYLDAPEGYNLHAFKTSGKPCSCYICSNDKYNRAKHRNERQRNNFE